MPIRMEGEYEEFPIVFYSKPMHFQQFFSHCQKPKKDKGIHVFVHTTREGESVSPFLYAVITWILILN